MFILPETIKDTDLEAELEKVCEEIKKAGGTIESKTRLGKRAFARRMHKQESGHYVIVTFSLDQQQIQPLMQRFKLNETVFRVQIVRAVAKESVAAASAKE